MNARNTLDSIRSLSNYLGGISGRRKAIVYFSEGIDYDINDVFTNRGATTIMSATQDAIAAATRANVAIYGIDARGLGAGADDLIEVQDLPTDASLNLGTTAFYNEVRLGQDSLRVLSSETGGFALVNTNDFNGGFERLVADNSAYYLLGYYSTNARRDGRYRKIEVKVRKPDLTVRARKGYVAARGRAESDKNDAKTPPELRDALLSPLPMSGLPLALGAAVFKGADNKGAVVISTLVAARDLPLTESGGNFTNRLDVVITATDYAGKSYPGDRSTLTLGLKPDSVPRLRAGGFRVLNQIDLPPGRYQLRVAVLEENSRRAGSVVYDLDVPDFSKEPLSISGLALTSASSSFYADGPIEGPARQDAAGTDDHLPRVRDRRRDRAVRRGLRQHRQAAAQGGHRGDAQGGRRPDRVPDPRGARQQRAGRRAGRLRLQRAHPAQGRGSGPLRAAGAGAIAGRQSAGSGPRDHHPRAGAAGAMTGPAAEPTSTGLDPQLASVLAYLGRVGDRGPVPDGGAAPPRRPRPRRQRRGRVRRALGADRPDLCGRAGRGS